MLLKKFLANDTSWRVMKRTQKFSNANHFSLWICILKLTYDQTQGVDGWLDLTCRLLFENLSEKLVTKYFKITALLILFRGGGGGGNSNYFLMGCAARGLKALPICKDFSPSKNGWFNIFLKIFANWEPFLRVLLSQKRLIFQFVLQFWWNGTSSLDFLTKMGPCLRMFDEKLTDLGGTSPYALTC